MCGCVCVCVRASMCVCVCGCAYLDADGPALPVQLTQHGADERRLTAADLPNHTDQRPLLHRQGDATIQSKNNKSNQQFTECIYFVVIPSSLVYLNYQVRLPTHVTPGCNYYVRVGSLYPACTYHLTVGNHAAVCTYIRIGTLLIL